MANAGLVNQSGVFIGTEAGVVTTKAVWVKSIIFYCHGAGDGCTIFNGANTYQALPKMSHSTALNNVVFDFGEGKQFETGLYINAISSGSMVGFVLKYSLLP